MISPEKLEQLQQSWAHLLSSSGVAPADAYPLFDRLVSAYSEPSRHYHDLEHICEMLRIVAHLADQTRDPIAVRLAVWFHDAVYDSRLSDNEERSAKLARDCLSLLGVSKETVDRVELLILATKHATTAASDPDTIVLLDADLAILGAEEKRYARYAEAIRQEYAWVPESDYRVGRAAVLRSFLGRPRIFLTQRMFEMGEAAARVNISKEIAALVTH